MGTLVSGNEGEAEVQHKGGMDGGEVKRMVGCWDGTVDVGIIVGMVDTGR